MNAPVGRQRVCPEGIKVVPISAFKKDALLAHITATAGTKEQNRMAVSIRDQVTDFPGFLLGIKDPANLNKSNRFRNPFDVPRSGLLDQVSFMRIFSLKPS